MTHTLSTCLWFDGNAKEAATFYKDVFGAVEILSENPYTINYTLFGRPFMHLNGGPNHPINPSISFFIHAETEAEIETYWAKLVEDGKILMPLNTYPWSEKYGWCTDKYGVSWQLIIRHQNEERIIPSLLFSGVNNGKASGAIAFYTGIFNESKTIHISKYEQGEADVEGNIKYAQFELNKDPFCIMDSSGAHTFSFNDGVSFMIMVDTQDEIDYYWNSLVKGGAPGRCGWLKDQYGVSWQIVPTALSKLMTSSEKAQKVTAAFLKMSKFIIADLEKAVQ